MVCRKNYHLFAIAAEKPLRQVDQEFLRLGVLAHQIHLPHLERLRVPRMLGHH